MLFEQMSGVSSEGPGAALANALEAALSTSSDAVKAHFIVQSVTKVGDNWKAQVSVVIEPEIEEKQMEEGQEPDNSEKAKPLKNLKKGKAPQPVVKRRAPILDYVPESDEEEEKSKKREKDHERKHQEELEAEARYRKTREYWEDRDRDALTHLYLEILYEDLFYNSIQPQFNFSYVHIVAEGSLWDEVNRRHPDMELYEAVHAIPEGDCEPKPNYQPSEYPELTEELKSE